jgi:hypothetical protein
VLERTSKGLALSSAATFKRVGTFQGMSCVLEGLAKAEGVSFVNDNTAAQPRRPSDGSTRLRRQTNTWPRGTLPACRSLVGMTRPGQADGMTP